MVDKKIVYGRAILAKNGVQNEIIKDGAIYIENGTIIDIGKYEEICNSHECEVKIGSEEHLVIPGLINSHHHGRGTSLLKMGNKDGPLEIWITYKLGKSLKQDIYHNALLTCINQIESGITTSLHHVYGHNPSELSHYEESMEKVVKAHIDSGMRAALALSIQDQDRYAYINSTKFNSRQPQRVIDKLGIRARSEQEISERVNNYFKVFNKLHEKYHDYDGRIKLLLGPTGVHWCSDELLQRIKKESQKLKVGIHMHLQESKYQRDYGYKVFNKSPLEHLIDLDFPGPEVSFAHCVWVSKEDINLLADSNSFVVHNPSSNLRLFNGVAPIPSMLDNGVNVALGIDGTGLNDDEDIFQEMRLCSIIHRKPGMKKYELYKRTLKPSRILDLATIIGAKAAGFDGSIGSIRVGMRADLVLIKSPEMLHYLGSRIPLEETLINWGRSNQVDTVIIDGKIILKNKKFVKLDKNNVIKKLAEDYSDTDPEAMQALQEYRISLRRYYEEWDECTQSRRDDS
jgi:cytosine/adenosine deaminase-related metal-dependent hydrolase